MMDFNFFKPYVDTNKGGNIKTTVLVGTSLTMAVIVGCITFNVGQKYFLRKNINKLQESINDTEFQSQYDEYKEAFDKQDILKEFNEKLDDIFIKVNDRVKLTPDLVKQINSTVPSKVFFENLKFENGGKMQIECKAYSRGQIADFEHNIKELDFIKDCHVTNITSDLNEIEEKFTFVINCELEEEYYDQNDQ